MQQETVSHAHHLREIIPLIAFHGASDTTVAPVNADCLLDEWLQPKSIYTAYLDASYAELAKTS